MNCGPQNGKNSHQILYVFCRARVLFRVPFLEELDLITVTVEEMIRANNMYNADGGDLLQRQEVFDKFYPDSNFVDYSIILRDDEMDIKISGCIV